MKTKLRQILSIGILALLLSQIGFSQSVDKFIDSSIKIDSLNVPVDFEQPYFPEELTEPKENNLTKKKDSTRIIDLDFRSRLPVEWYSKHLFAMNEPLLFNRRTKKEIYRFTWLRTFDKPMTFRFEKTNDEYILYWKVLSGAGGYDPGVIIIERLKVLSKKEWTKFIQLIQKADFWNMDLGRYSFGNDGSEWIMEGVNNTNYRVVSVWSPDKGSFYNACDYLISLTDLEISEENKY